MDLIKRAKKVIPGGSQTYSKSSRYFTRSLVAEYGIGGRLYTTDNDCYDDYSMALGAVILGYEAVVGTIPPIYSLPHPIEIEAAEKLCEIIPSAQMVKFFKNGSDAVEIAVRLARAWTGKNSIQWMSYHGFHDSYISSCHNPKGIPIQYSYYNYDSRKIIGTKQLPMDLAAIVIEPDHPEIKTYAEIAKENNCLLIFDEVLTGFRHGVGGLQKNIAITPDISCFGKCMANGLPLSAVVGRSDIMQLLEEGVFGSSTFGGDVIALSACLDTISRLEMGAAEYIWKIGQRYLDGIDRKQVEKFGVVKGLPPRCGIEFNNLKYKSHFQDELLKRNILVNGLNNFCRAHTESQIDIYIEATNEVLKIMGKEEYKGKLIEPMFKR